MNLPYLYSVAAVLLALLSHLITSCFASTSSASDDDGAILVLGDSWASLSGSFLANVCTLGLYDDPPQPRVISNSGKSGSTAKQWASGNLATKPFNNAQYDYDYVWLSIGGNDFNCDESIHDQIAQNILKVISDIFESSSNDGIQVLFTGYGYPSKSLCGSGDITTSLFDSLSFLIRQKIEQSPYGKRVETMDISSLYVTEESRPLSDSRWYADGIHINEAGYVRLFSLDKVQAFFGCIASSTETPSIRPSFAKTSAPSVSLSTTEAPSIKPSFAKTSAPSVSLRTTEAPSIKPSFTKTSAPSVSLRTTEAPSIRPSFAKTSAPSVSLRTTETPSIRPSFTKTSAPSVSLRTTETPSIRPSFTKTSAPSVSLRTSESPSIRPSFAKTSAPSISLGNAEAPSIVNIPTMIPSDTTSKDPTKQPSDIPSKSPSDLSSSPLRTTSPPSFPLSSCTEDPNAKFFYFRRIGRAFFQTCRWLELQREAKIVTTCGRTKSAKGVGPAKEVCRNTCQTCDKGANNK